MQNRIKYIILFILLLNLFSCENSVAPIEFNNATLIYVQTGGFYASYEKLNVDNFGLVTYKSATFSSTLQLQLTENEYNEIKSFYNDFIRYKDEYPGGCIDDFHYKLTLKDSEKEKSIEFDGCSIENNPELDNIVNLTSILNKLRRRIYEEKETWEGLIYDFYTNKEEYSSSEKIWFLCKILNSTNTERKIYFRNKYKIQVGLHSITNDPHIQFWTPDNSVLNSDTTGFSEIILSPKEEVIVNYPWEQKFTNFDQQSYDSLPSGKYSSWIFLRGGPYPAKNDVEFQIK
jgi:hypothetical protein